ncbi:hybrid sensor histidine kinase/response regulator [Dapis sp. BLCC M126]|uniref:hybrid sensor histidine kinase/response regulator n=1 Tax=Dapis sp. BLCC M126 TaxID=3400189 RepID=UPI003CEF772D
MKNSISILVVDDEPENFDVIEGLFLNQDYELSYSPSGQDAIDSLGIYFHPDLILLDVMMPEIDGIEVCRQIKAMPEWQAVPIIMITALTSKEDLARCLAAGADDFISKPVNSLELRARVHSMVRIKQQYDKIQNWSRLQQSTIQLLESSLTELRGNLARSLSHELNTPLNGILSSFLLLDSYLDDMDTEEIQEIINIGTTSAKRLEKVTQKFLTYLYLELQAHKSLDDQTSDIDLQEAETHTSFISEIAPAQAKAFDRFNDLTMEIQAATIRLTSQHLQWLIDELLDNAFKFSEPQTPVKIYGQVVDEVFQLNISDCGRGMTQDQIDKIGAFMQFERYNYEQQGVGLGLKIAQKIIDLYRGKMLIFSTYQKETIIQIELPGVQEVTS